MNAIILSVGEELTLGQTVDTNSAWISQHLAAAGCEILAHKTVSDDQKAIELAIRSAAGTCDVIVISGGMGPTEDDLTRQSLAAVMNVPLELNEAWLARLRDFFHKLGREMPKTNTIQAMIPRGATMIENTCGTAAGIDAMVESLEPVELDQASADDLARLFAKRDRLGEAVARLGWKTRLTRVFVMPGVPKEMKAMFTRDVLPVIKQKSGGAVILLRNVHTFGLGESGVAEKLGELMSRTRNPSVGTTVSDGIVSLRLHSRFASLDEAQKQLDQTDRACREALGDLVFGADEDTLATVLAKSLASSRKTVATAESCTGGLLAKMLTDVPGSSDYFAQGWITYSNEAKTNRLGVSENVIKLHGAVSEPVVEAMASGARRLAKSDYALAISGVAGPGGGTVAKPVGMVCIGIASAHATDKQLSQVQSRTLMFNGDREMVRDRAAKMALTMLRFKLMDKPMPF